MRSYTVEELYQIIEDRLDKIDLNKELFTLSEINNCKNEHWIFKIFYKEEPYTQVSFYNSMTTYSDGRITIRSFLTITAQNDSKWYNSTGCCHNIHLDNYLRVNSNVNGNKSFDDFLEDKLPIRDEETVKVIAGKLDEIGVQYSDIRFDTYKGRYVIEGNLSTLLNVDTELSPSSETSPVSYVYKYMSLGTYMNMLAHKTMRMNSIVSMNDTSESFFLGDFLCNAFSDKEEKYQALIANKNMLISSFSSLYDDALMWRLYGDNGKGVCLSFHVNSDNLKPIVYIDERNSKLVAIKKLSDSLKEQNIIIYIQDLDSYQYRVKSSQFMYEKEHRLTHTCPEKELNFTQYGELISFYKDFKFEGDSFEEINLKPRSLTLGSNLPVFDVNYPLLVDLSNRVFKISRINFSAVDKLRI